MRSNIFVVLVICTLGCVGLASAHIPVQIKPARPVRHLKSSAEEGVAVSNAAGEERTWQDIVEKLKGTNILKNAEENKGADAATWESVAEKAEAGGKLQPENAAKVRWQNALAKLKAEGKLTEASEEKVTKTTEEAALAVKKNPKKWPYIKKALEITFGATLTAVIVVGIDGMIGGSD